MQVEIKLKKKKKLFYGRFDAKQKKNEHKIQAQTNQSLFYVMSILFNTYTYLTFMNMRANQMYCVQHQQQQRCIN